MIQFSANAKRLDNILKLFIRCGRSCLLYFWQSRTVRRTRNPQTRFTPESIFTNVLRTKLWCYLVDVLLWLLSN